MRPQESCAYETPGKPSIWDPRKAEHVRPQESRAYETPGKPCTWDPRKAEHMRPWKIHALETPGKLCVWNPGKSMHVRPQESSVRGTPEKPWTCYLCILIHNFLQILQQMVVGTTFFLINIHDPVQVWEVPVQIYSLGIAATYKPVLQFTRLRKATQKPSLCITAVSTHVRSPSVLSKTVCWDYLVQRPPTLLCSLFRQCTPEGTQFKILVISFFAGGGSISMNVF